MKTIKYWALVDDVGGLFCTCDGKISIYCTKEDAINDMAHGETLTEITVSY